MTIEIRVDVPADPRFVGMFGELAAHAARLCGCQDAKAAEFAGRVKDSVHEQFAGCGREAVVVVTVRQTHAAVEVVIGTPQGARTLSLVI